MSEDREAQAVLAIETIDALVETYEALPADAQVSARGVAAVLAATGIVVKAAMPDIARELMT